MQGESLRYEALNGLDRLSAATSPTDILNVMATALNAFGADFFCINFLPAPLQKFEEVVLAHRVPPDWLKLYVDNEFCNVDPSLRHCRHTTHPFEYLEAPFDRENEPEAAEVVRRAGDFGLAQGFLVPVAGLHGCEGDVWIGGYHLRLAEQEKPVVHLLSLYAFECAKKLSGRYQPATPSLTSRQREVLSWIATGKSAWEIGEILDISKRTVDEHTANAARKLNAKNRVHSVAIAVRYGLIDL
jgi:LuxR family quorum sensing-dependent transcriptional regulator